MRWALVAFSGLCLLAGQANASEYVCRKVEVNEATTKAALSGIEDLVFHRKSNSLILSVHDRWGDRDGDANAISGLFSVSFEELRSPASKVLARRAQAGDNIIEGMKPHGIALRSANDGADRLAVIDHQDHQQEIGPNGRPGTTVDIFDVTSDGRLEPVRRLGEPAMCPANDLDWLDDERLIVSLDRTNCGGFWRFLELSRGQWRGKLAIIDLPEDKGMTVVATELGFPNGVLVDGDKILISYSREERLASYRLEDGKLVQQSSVGLQGGGDNLALSPDGSYLLAVHPDLFDFGLYSLRVWGFDTAPTQLVRVGRDLSPSQILYESEDGDPLSGVTGLVEIEGLLIGGAAFDEGLAVCEPK